MQADKLRELLAKATPGVWRAASKEAADGSETEIADCGGYMESPDEATKVVCVQEDYTGLAADDAALIAAMHEALPELLTIAEASEGLRAENARLLGLLNSPELHDFTRGVVLEAGHQRERWGTDHDSGKGAQDWFWLVGYLAGKALASHLAGNTDKALHHTITAAAAMANWHGAILGTTNMRPGIDGDAALSGAVTAGEGQS